MAFITEFIDMFVSTLSTIWNFFIGLLENFILFFKYLFVVSDLSNEIINSMPSWLQTFGFITLTVSILYLILGRSTGGQKE